MKLIGYIFGWFAVLAISAVTHGWAFSILWRWFFIGFPPISIPIACGLWLTIRFLTGSVSPNVNLGKSLFTSIFSPPLTVGVGWIIYQFVHMPKPL